MPTVAELVDTARTMMIDQGVDGAIAIDLNNQLTAVSNANDAGSAQDVLTPVLDSVTATIDAAP